MIADEIHECIREGLKQTRHDKRNLCMVDVSRNKRTRSTKFMKHISSGGSWPSISLYNNASSKSRFETEVQRFFHLFESIEVLTSSFVGINDRI